MTIDLPIYSPVEEIHDQILSNKGIRLFIKRDDMIHPFISGNKWRKLKYILLDARDTGKNHLVTFGGAYSNHLLATACAAAKFGFQSTGFVRGEEVSNDILGLCSLFGMELKFTDRNSYNDKIALFDAYYKHSTDAYFIDEGGAGELAVKGCAEMTDEFDIAYDHLFCAAGTGTTSAGIIKGLQELKLNTHPHIIPVLKGGDFLRSDIEKYTNHPFKLHTDYHFGGYAKSTPGLLSFIEKFCQNTGILIEPVYTGKLFFAIFDLIIKDKFTPGSTILAIHTGGLTGITGMLNKFKS